MAFTMTRKRDSRLVPYMLLAFIVVGGIIELLAFVLGHPILFLVPAVLFGVLAATIVFGRRAQKAAYSQMGNSPGAALMVLKGMRGDWRVTEAVAATTQLDTVHRVLARPGVILVGEGSPHRVRNLIAQEKKRVNRVVGETPIYTIMIGDEEDQVPISKLQAHLVKLPRNVLPKELGALEKRLQALPGARKSGIPAGPIPAKAQRQIQDRMMRQQKRR